MSVSNESTTVVRSCLLCKEDTRVARSTTMWRCESCNKGQSVQRCKGCQALVQLSGSIFTWACPSCGTHQNMVKPLPAGTGVPVPAPAVSPSSPKQDIARSWQELSPRGRLVAVAIVLFIVIGVLVGGQNQGSSNSSSGGSDSSSQCETNYQNRDPYTAENDHDRFIANCENALKLQSDVDDCVSANSSQVAQDRCISQKWSEDN